MRKWNGPRHANGGSWTKDENRNPAGSKLVRRFYRAKHGVREDYAKSLKWYSELIPVAAQMRRRA